ncbi:hypothetical protein [Klebsiella grimontii]|uniref:hypothetical protein n=1 Tax=Klebsiella grimontii TaxID=2058152 RepID=UPI003D80732A
MSSLPEQPAWESGIHQLEESERAKAGPGGILNRQASQLANRTKWLREQVESAVDYREYTFRKTESDPDGTIAGLSNTPVGKLFRVVQGVDAELSFIYYLNDGGLPVPVAELPGQQLIREVDKRISQVDGENITEIHDETGNIIGYLAADGRLFLPYLSNSVQDILNFLSGLLSSRSGTDIFRLGDGKNDTFIQGGDGRVYVPLLDLSIQDCFKRIESYASLETGKDI